MKNRCSFSVCLLAFLSLISLMFLSSSAFAQHSGDFKYTFSSQAYELSPTTTTTRLASTTSIKSTTSSAPVELSPTTTTAPTTSIKSTTSSAPVELSPTTTTIQPATTTTTICDGDYWKNLYEQTKAELDACLNPSVQIEISTLAATPSDKKVILKWKTETETDNAGFNVWRSDNFVKINDGLIPALGSAVSGSEYDFVDEWVLNGKRYFYLLEDIDTNGMSTFHGPVKAVPRMIYGMGKEPVE